MDPKDRLETVAKTKLAAKREQAAAGDEPAEGARYRVPQADADRIIEDWPAAPNKVAQELFQVYGPPNEATPTLLIWHDNGPWKRTIITSDETLHKFPTPHTDYITQTINYQIPVDKLPDLARFDGSLIVYRTAGQVSATCDNEAANLLTMNLMHEIVQGTRTVEEARQEFGEQTAAWLMNRPAPYTEAILFDLPDESETGYPDEPVMKGATIRQTVGKVKDALGLGDDT